MAMVMAMLSGYHEDEEAFEDLYDDDDDDLDENDEHAAWCGPDCDGTVWAEGGTYPLRCDCACHTLSDALDAIWW